MEGYQLIIEEYKDNINKKIETLVVDIDGVIATIVEDGNYVNSNPIKDNIRFINKLKLSGIKIILFTARGSVTGKDWYQVTKNQMQKWGVLFNELRLGKPAGDLYIDDKAATPSVLEILADKIEKV